MYFSVGISQDDKFNGRLPLVLLNNSMEENINKAAEMGFKGAEIFAYDADALDIAGAVKYAASKGVKISGFCSYPVVVAKGYTVVNPDRELEEGARKFLMTLLEKGADYHLPISIGSFRGKRGALTADEYKERIAENLKPCLDLAERTGNYLSIEAISRDATDWGHTVREILEFIDYVGSPALKLNYDTFHAHVNERNQYDAIKLAGDKVGVVHITDSDRWYPGHAQIDFLPVMMALTEIGYDASCSFEYMANPDPISAASLGLKYCEAAKAMAEVRLK